MEAFRVTIYFVSLFLIVTKVRGLKHNVTESPISGFMYEILDTRLEILQTKLNEMELTRRQDREMLERLLSVINQLNQTMVENHIALQTQSSKMISQLTAYATHDEIRKEITVLATKKDLAMLQVNPGILYRNVSSRSCVQEQSKHSGKYIIQATENDYPFVGYCDQTTLGGGWLVFQYRFDGSVDFYLNWTEYRDGFGSMDGEFWLGLEKLHRITAARKHELLVELKDFDGKYIYARYDEFEIGSEEEQYPLKKLGSYSGTATDALKYHRDMKFSTKDRRNDIHPIDDCATLYKGAWWYNKCMQSHLNGVYENINDPKAIGWFYYKNSWQGFAYSRMSIREV
uniref:fibrinogen-like protein A n=1 Tax=Anopheles coluzzii TaxID=1518534 RepID=UPI0020FFC50C|nr:fibrinogen-like protein A [Anopheles coluzzii]